MAERGSAAVEVMVLGSVAGLGVVAEAEAGLAVAAEGLVILIKRKWWMPWGSVEPADSAAVAVSVEDSAAGLAVAAAAGSELAATATAGWVAMDWGARAPAAADGGSGAAVDWGAPCGVHRHTCQKKDPPRCTLRVGTQGS